METLTVGSITPRQLQVTRLVAAGWTNAEIARELELGVTTVQRHIESARWALQARNRVHLVAIAVRAGLV